MKRFVKNIFSKKSKLTNDEQIDRRTFLSFFAFFGMFGLGATAWIWLRKQPPDGGIRGGIPTPLRKVLNQDEKLFSHSLSPNHLAKEYPKSEATPLQNVRINGAYGLEGDDFDAATWTLTVQKANSENLTITLDEIRKLPKTEVVYNFKCIEGWNQIQWWGGVRFADFIQHFNLTKEAAMNYVGMMTPDEEYYVGIDMPSAMHPQTLLCYELNGMPLPDKHGAPLRLIIPVKYGVKSLKRIGAIYFDNEKPSDYWAERGYDYYCGL